MDVAPRHQHGFHAGIFARLHVTLGVAHVQTGFGRDVDLFTSVKHRFGAGLGFGCGVAAHHHIGSNTEAQLRHQAVGESVWLVGDDAPFQAARMYGLYQVIDALKQHRVLVKTGFISVQVLLTQTCMVGVGLVQIHAQLQQAAGAMTGHGANFVHAHFGQTLLAQHGV